MLVLGHRGAPREAAENTLESFRRAMEQGADGFEFDVRRSADGRLVVVHDPRLGACAVARSTYARLRATRRGAAMPLLADVLREFGGAFLDIELKIAGIEAAVLEQTAKFCAPSRFVVTSFHRAVVTRVKELDPTVAVGWLFDRKAPAHLWQELDVQFLAPHYRVLDSRLAEAARRRGLRLITWTANSPQVVRRVIELGVDVVITDLPGQVLALAAPGTRQFLT